MCVDFSFVCSFFHAFLARYLSEGQYGPVCRSLINLRPLILGKSTSESVYEICDRIILTHRLHSSKVLLPMVCYVFQDGPWRDTLVRFNYDPRKDPDARL
jgi:hypothetical protein